MIAVVCLTAGRDDYLAQTIASFEERVRGPITCRVMFDDSGDSTAMTRLGKQFPDFAVIGDVERRGQAAKIRSIFNFLQGRTEKYVFWLEEDFTFDRDVDLLDLVELLEEHPEYSQAQLLRQSWYPVEVEAGGIIERNPERFTLRDFGGDRPCAIEHREYWTWNPCLFRREEIIDRTYPLRGDHEQRFGLQLLREDIDRRFAIVGDGAPWVTHIGAEKA